MKLILSKRCIILTFIDAYWLFLVVYIITRYKLYEIVQCYHAVERRGWNGYRRNMYIVIFDVVLKVQVRVRVQAEEFVERLALGPAFLDKLNKFFATRVKIIGNAMHDVEIFDNTGVDQIQMATFFGFLRHCLYLK